MRRDGSAHRGPKPRHKVALTAPEYRALKRLARLRTAPHAEVVRAKILLLAYEHPDWSNAAIARGVGCTDRTVRKWRHRSRAGPTFKDAPRRGAPRFFPLSGPGPGHRSRLHAAPGFRQAALSLVSR
jgi:Homeodomain-like domain